MKNTNTTRLHGVLPVLPTPFDKDDRVDPAAMERVTRFCLEAGARGLVFPGVASEYDHLTPGERLSLLEIVCQTAEARVPVVCGGGKGGAAEIGNGILRARELGAVAAMVLIPNRFVGDVGGALRFILSVIEHAPGVDIVLQNAAAPVGAGLAPDEVIEIVEASPAIRYIKEETLPSGPRITTYRENMPEHLVGVIGGGGGRHLIDELIRGAIGAMPAAEITDLHVRMWNAFEAGDVAQARDLYMRTLPLLMIQQTYRMRLTKHVLTRRGILNNAAVRAPLPEFDAFDEVELDVQLESLADLFETARPTTMKL